MPTFISSNLNLLITQIENSQPLSCPLCRRAHPQSIGYKDFNQSCNDHFQGSRTFPNCGVLIQYFQCQDCDFVFTNDFDSWSHDDFKKYIYNDDYIKNDAPFTTERPYRNASMVAGLWHSTKDVEICLDYGGGNGVFADKLTELGLETKSCDPFYGQPTDED